MIRIRNLSHAYEGAGIDALAGVDLDIPDGARVAVVGPNGSGKTTLLRHMNGLLPPRGGEVRVDGMSTADPSALPGIRQALGMVFQNPDNQLVGMTVEEDVAFGPENLRLPSREIRKRVDRALETVGLADFAERPPHTLSSGEKQLAAVAGVLAMGPRHIALDEPTAYLDPAGRRKVLRVIDKLHEQGISIIHVTHDMDEAAFAEQVVVMDRGRIRMQGPPSEVFQKTAELRDLGLDIPVVADLAGRLRRRGFEIGQGVLTLEEACDALCALLTETRSA